MKGTQHEALHTLPPRKRAEDDARDLLKAADMAPTDPQYAFFVRLLTAILYTTAIQTALINDYGKLIARLARAPIRKSQRERLQWTAADLQNLKLSADYRSAMRLVSATAKSQRGRRISNSNLRRTKARLTRTQAIASVEMYGTQAKAAEANNISERRLRKIINGR